jgi:hypothetical protein
MAPSPLDELDVFYGELTVARGQVYVRLPRPGEDSGWSLAGQVRGPRCLHAQALPLTAPLVDLGPGPTLLARALLPDPVFWSSDLPAIYDVTINLLRGKEIIASARREIGLRSLGIRGRSLHLAGKRWVLRGVASSSTTATLPRDWHSAVAALYWPAARSPTDQQLVEASQWGSLAIVELAQTGEAAAVRLQDLTRFPAVAMAVIQGDLPAGFKAAQTCPNVLIAQTITGKEFHPQPWAQLIVVSADDPQQFARVAAAVDLPVIAVRRLCAPIPIAEARAACDVLQRDLASIGQFAGYVV